MRRNQTDEADGADEGHGGGGQQGDGDEGAAAQAVHMDAEARSIGIAEAQGGERPGVADDERRAEGNDGDNDGHRGPASFEQAAEEPVHDLLQGFRAGDELQ